MMVATSRFGVIEIDVEKIITLTSPFLGFPVSRRFILRPHGKTSPFMWLQSIDDPNLAFVVVQSEMISPTYKPKIPQGVRQELEIPQDGSTELLLILTIPKGRPMEMTANLLGPIVINAEKRLAKQILLDPMVYDPCQPLFQ